MAKRPHILVLVVVDGKQYVQERLQRGHDETQDQFTERVTAMTRLMQRRHDP